MNVRMKRAAWALLGLGLCVGIGLTLAGPYHESRVDAQTARLSLSSLQDQITDLEAQVEATKGETVTVWGTWSPPLGTELVYTGYAYASNYQHSGSASPYVVANETAPSFNFGNQNGHLAYPVVTQGPQLPGMPPSGSLVRASVVRTLGPTVVLWGTRTPGSIPAGWRVLYEGWAMGGHYTHSGPNDPICVNVSFQYQPAPGGPGYAYIYKTELEGPVSGTGYGQDDILECMVLVKDLY